MPSIKIPRTTYQGLTLPGGWKADVPQIEVHRNDPRLRTLVLRFQRLGMKPLDAEEAARDAITRFFEREWRARLMKIVGRWAKLYADQNHGSLEGFDPEMVADLWIPGATFLSQGAPDVKAAFVAMRRGLEK